MNLSKIVMGGNGKRAHLDAGLQAFMHTLDCALCYLRQDLPFLAGQKNIGQKAAAIGERSVDHFLKPIDTPVNALAA